MCKTTLTIIEGEVTKIIIKFLRNEVDRIHRRTLAPSERVTIRNFEVILVTFYDQKSKFPKNLRIFVMIFAINVSICGLRISRR